MSGVAQAPGRHRRERPARGGLAGRARAYVADPLIVNSALLMATTTAMALAGAVFWVIAARLAPAESVGLASSLVTTTEALAVLAMLGFNVSLLHTMPRSDRQRADVVFSAAVVAGVAAVLAAAYALALPHTAPKLAAVVAGPLVVGGFVVLVAATAVNQLTDTMFLAVDRVRDNFVINGVVLSGARVGAAALLTGAGAFAIFGAVAGTAATAATLSLLVLLRRLPGRLRQRPSQALRHSARFTGAGYVSTVLLTVPQLVFPVLIINALGATESAYYFVGFQIVTLLNHVVFMVSNSMYAEVSRAPERAEEIMAKAARTIAVLAGAGIVVLVVAAPLVLHLFGARYAEGATPTLRILALGTIGVAFNYWNAVRLRIARHLPAMVVVQAITTAIMLVLAYVGAQLSLEWAAAAWGVGQAVGGLVGHVVSRTLAPISSGLAPGEAATGDAAPALAAPSGARQEDS